MNTKRIWVSMIIGWTVGGLLLALLWNKPLMPLAAVASFIVTFVMLQVFPR